MSAEPHQDQTSALRTSDEINAEIANLEAEREYVAQTSKMLLQQIGLKKERLSNELELALDQERRNKGRPQCISCSDFIEAAANESTFNELIAPFEEAQAAYGQKLDEHGQTLGEHGKRIETLEGCTK
jgi:hypothetical protein